MKRITTLLLACVFAFGSIGVAKADGIDVKVSGTWDFAFGWVGNKGFTNTVNRTAPNAAGRDDDKFEARQRVRTQINFITSEFLQAVLMFEIGNLDWGRPGTGRQLGAGLDADGVNIETKRAFLDWIIPNTEISVRMGIQGLRLPSTRMGSPVFDADVAGIVVSSPITDWLAATAFWIRPFDQYRNRSNWDGNRRISGDYSDAVDAFGLVLPVTMDGWSLAPYFVYGFVGANSGLYDYLFTGNAGNSVRAEESHAKAWWLGTNFELSMFDPLTFSFDFVYGHLQKTDVQGLAGVIGSSPHVGTKGWFLAATLDYRLDFMTPGIFGWYATGDDADDVAEGQLGRIPVVGIDGGFQATTFGQAGYYSIGNTGGAIVTNTATGTWGIGVQLADMTFIEDLSHTLRVAYYRGTNDPDVVRDLGAGFANVIKYNCDALYLTEDDSVWEVNFDHQYRIYENLTAVLELGYLHLNSDRGTWGRNGNDESDSAWKAEIMFRYAF